MRLIQEGLHGCASPHRKSIRPRRTSAPRSGSDRVAPLPATWPGWRIGRAQNTADAGLRLGSRVFLGAKSKSGITRDWGVSMFIVRVIYFGLLLGLALVVSSCCKGDCDCGPNQMCQLGYCRAGAQPHNSCPNGGPCTVGAECTSKVCSNGGCVALASKDPCDNGTGVGIHGSTCFAKPGCGVCENRGPPGVLCMSGNARGPLNANSCDASKDCWLFGNPPAVNAQGLYVCSNGNAGPVGPNYPAPPP